MKKKQCLNKLNLVNDLVCTTSIDTTLKCRNDISVANSFETNSTMNDFLKPKSTYSKECTCKLSSEADSISSYSCGSSMNEKSFKDSYENNNLSNTIETGRISEGGYSSQKFNNVNIDFEYYPFQDRSN